MRCVLQTIDPGTRGIVRRVAGQWLAWALCLLVVGSPVLDVGNVTLLPGLTDAHTHLMARIPEGDSGYAPTLEPLTGGSHVCK